MTSVQANAVHTLGLNQQKPKWIFASGLWHWEKRIDNDCFLKYDIDQQGKISVYVWKRTVLIGISIKENTVLVDAAREDLCLPSHYQTIAEALDSFGISTEGIHVPLSHGSVSLKSLLLPST